MLHVELLRENDERKDRANPNLRISDGDMQTIACSSQSREHRLVRATRCSSLLESDVLSWNVRENHSRPLVAIVAPRKADDDPHETKQKEPDEVALEKIMEVLHRECASDA